MPERLTEDNGTVTTTTNGRRAVLGYTPRQLRDILAVDGLAGMTHIQPFYQTVRVNNNVENKTMTKEDIKSLLKERHLDREHRILLHTPKKDWEATNNGEKCKNANTLPIDDILIKHKIK